MKKTNRHEEANAADGPTNIGITIGTNGQQVN